MILVLSFLFYFVQEAGCNAIVKVLVFLLLLFVVCDQSLIIYLFIVLTRLCLFIYIYRFRYFHGLDFFFQQFYFILHKVIMLLELLLHLLHHFRLCIQIGCRGKGGGGGGGGSHFGWFYFIGRRVIGIVRGLIRILLIIFFLF